MDFVSNSQSYIAERIVAGIGATALSIFSFMVLRTALQSGNFDILVVSLSSSSATAGIVCWWIVLRYQHEVSRKRIRLATRCGFIMGGICLAAEWVWCAVMDPQGNIGPILGILVTGPLGFALGLFGGYIYGLLRSG